MDLSIIIVNFKTPELTLRAIESIIKTLPVSYEIIIVDNASSDHSEKLIKSKYPDIIWIQNKTNEGFGRANNKGFETSQGKYILLMNSDLVLLEDTVSICLKVLKKDSEIGVLGCKLLNEEGSLQKSTFSIASFRKLLDQNLVINKFWPMGKEPIEAVMGSFMMMPRKVFDETGGFDPDFFMYAEELDLCHRIARKGYKIEYFKEATAIHKNGGSTTNKDWSMKQRYLSNALLFLKARVYWGYLLYHLLFLLNTVTNFFAMWLLDACWRQSYLREQKYYFSNFGQYFTIPFLYSRKPGNGKQLLKRNP